MTAQLAINFEASRTARDAGMQAAVDHADDCSIGWSDRAYEALCEFAACTPMFTSMEFRRSSYAASLDLPPTPKAFGSIFVKACKRGVIRKAGYRPHPERHQSPTVLWSSI